MTQKDSIIELLETSQVKKNLNKSNSKSSLRIKKKRRQGRTDKLQLIGPYQHLQTEDEQAEDFINYNELKMQESAKENESSVISIQDNNCLDNKYSTHSNSFN